MPRATSRQVAWDLLRRIDMDGAFANLAVPEALAHADLSERDRAFVTELVYGTTRMRRACDHLIDRFVIRDPSPELRSLLRMGAYQLHHLAQPAHAAVHATVQVAPKGSRGFINAVLRKVASAPVIWPNEATRLSYPDWIVRRLQGELGDADAFAVLTHMNTAPSRTIRADGYTQDKASTWIAEHVGAQPGERVLDLCAAPGGKATALAASGATVIAADLRPHRAALVAANATQLGLSVPVVIGDGTAPPFQPASFDRVLVDAPCSGLGALRRRPDARWRITETDIDVLAGLQRQLIDSAVHLTRPGGVVIYSVCTLTAAESIDLDRAELAAVVPPGPPWTGFGRGARVLPHEADSDGMTVLGWHMRRQDR
jgi:16S rRNA (cytosine967-C5)-methyltransferase